MAGNIKGIIVEIGGDTSGLENALKKVNKSTSSLSKELKGINSLLKLDPKNTELLAQKQKVLGDEIANVSKRLELLKDRQKEIANSPELAEHRDQYRNLQREIIKTELELKSLKIEASGWTQASRTLEGIGNTLTNLGNGITEVGKKASVASAAVGALFAAGIKYNADIETATKSYEAFIGSAEEAEQAVQAIRDQSKTSPFATTDLIRANQMLISTGISADEARNTISALADAIALTGGGNDELTRMASNLQQIQNAGKATSMDIRQFAYAGIDVYGILAETTGKNVEEIKKMDVTYEELSRALQTAAAEGGKYYKGQEQGAETLNGKINQLKKSFQDLLGELTKSLLPIINNIITGLQNLAKWFNGLSQSQKDMITKIGTIIALLSPALIIIGKLITFAGSIFLALSKVFGIMAKIAPIIGTILKSLSFLLNPITAIIAAVAAVGAGLVALYNHNEAFREKVDEIWNAIKSLVMDTIVPAVQQAFELIKKVLENIGNFIHTTFDTAANFLIGVGNTIYSRVISPIIGFFQNNLVPAITAAVNTIKNVFSGIIGTISNIWETVKTTFSNAIDWIRDTFGGAWSSVWQGIVDVFTGIWDGMTSGIKGVINGIIGALNTFINGINRISFDVPDWVPVIGGKKWGFNIPSIPELASGGIAMSDTLARIGEGRDPEAVIPLGRTLTHYMAEALKEAGAMNTIQVNFYPQKMTDAELERAFNYVDRRYGMAY